MATRKSKTQEHEIDMLNDKTVYIDQDIDREMRSSFLDYSMSVIVSRALPDVRDGLKPVHRRILYTLYEKGLDHSHPYHKSADTVGSVLGSYHPHGDASVYDALVRLAQTFSLRYPLVDGQGNFGSVDGDPPAAYRYTEARMAKIADEMLRDIEKETVDFVPNYDDSKTEPSVLPSKIPNLLVNGSVGIAVGMATNIPTHNLSEVCDGICYLIDNPDCDFNDLNEYIKGPDFPTGGIIMGRSGIRSAYATGRGKITLRGRAEIEEMPHHAGRYQIIISEIPYMVNKSVMVTKIADLVKEKRLEGISDLRDESDRNGMRVVVEIKQGANAQVVLNNLYKLTPLQDTVGVIMLALDGGVPKIMDLKTILQKYIDFQYDVNVRATQYDLKKALEREHLLEGMKIACDNIDEVIHIIRNSYDDAKERLMERFGLDDIQATAILDMRLKRLQGLEIEKIEQELAEVRERIAYYRLFISDKNMVLEQIKKDLLDIKAKYGDERLTDIENVSGEVDIEDLIPNDENIFTFTNRGYVKRQAKDTYQTQRRGGRGIIGTNTKEADTENEKDFVSDLFITKTHNYIIFATDKGRIYRLKGYEIPRGSRTSHGVNIVNLLQLQDGEKVTSVIPTQENEEGVLVMITKRGVIKRCNLDDFRNVRKAGLRAIDLDEGDELAWSGVTSGDDDLILATQKGMAIRINENDVRIMGRTARGVRALKLRGDDIVVGMGIVKDGKQLLTITQDGKGRRTPVESYNTQARGGFGVHNYSTKRDSLIAGVSIVDDADDVIAISHNGIIIRMHAADIGIFARTAAGVRVMKLGEGDKVATFVTTLRDDEVEKSVENMSDPTPQAADDSELEQLIEAEYSQNPSAENDIEE